MCLWVSPCRIFILSPVSFVISPMRNSLLGLTRENFLKFDIFPGESNSPHRGNETGCISVLLNSCSGKKNWKLTQIYLAISRQLKKSLRCRLFSLITRNFSKNVFYKSLVTSCFWNCGMIFKFVTIYLTFNNNNLCLAHLLPTSFLLLRNG